jgi:hypothetical protein
VAVASVLVASVPAAIGRAAFVLAGIGQLVAIVAVRTPTAVVPMATAAVPMATVLGARRQRARRSGLRRLARRPRTITATNAATIPIQRATSLTRKVSDHISRLGRLTNSGPPVMPGGYLRANMFGISGQRHGSEVYGRRLAST